MHIEGACFNYKNKNSSETCEIQCRYTLLYIIYCRVRMCQIVCVQRLQSSPNATQRTVTNIFLYYVYGRQTRVPDVIIQNIIKLTKRNSIKSYDVCITLVRPRKNIFIIDNILSFMRCTRTPNIIVEPISCCRYSEMITRV